MATQDKLYKSLEILNSLIRSNNQPSDINRKKEKIHHCHVITDAIANPAIRVSPVFNNILGSVVETFLKLCDDAESDIRMTSEECLNITIRALGDEVTGKVEIELHKEIRKNGAARSLRAALTRFAQLAHLIGPKKGKPYVDNLFPSIVKITERTEEQIHETLALSLPKIIKVLGCFSHDNEIKMLLKAFLLNVSNQSAVIRRTTSNCIVAICIHCRKPNLFINYCLNNLLDLLIPINDEQSNYVIFGVMTCFKNLLPHIKMSNENEPVVVPVEKLLQIYELCLHYLQHDDHNVINACLEALNILLQNTTTELKHKLLNPQGLEANRIFNSKSLSLLKLRSPSQLSMATNLTLGDENLFSENELTETLHLDIEKWIDESKLTVMNVTAQEKSPEFHDSTVINNTNFETSSDTGDYREHVTSKVPENLISENRSNSISDNLERLTMSENSSERSFSCEEKIINKSSDKQEVFIGDFLDKDVSLNYCTGLIVKSFLLTGTAGSRISDKSVRVSVKSLALSCLASIVHIYPKVLLKYLDKSYFNIKINNKTISNQQISDVLLFADHSDPQLRGTVRLIIANFLEAVLFESRGNYDEWINENSIVEDSGPTQISNLVKIFLTGLEDENSNCAKQTLQSLAKVLNCLLESSSSFHARPILHVLPLLAKNPYWLVKVELCELVVTLPYITIHYITKSNEFQNKVIFNILLELLKESDQRVRNSAANSIVKIVSKLYNETEKIKDTNVTAKAINYKNLYLSNLYDSHLETNLNKKYFIDNMPFPYKKMLQSGCEEISYFLSKIINKLYNCILTSTCKEFVFGCIETLSLLSNTYPSTLYSNCWQCINKNLNNKIPDLLSIFINLLNNSVIAYDISCQINILNVAFNLYAGQSVLVLKPIADAETENQSPWDMFTQNSLSEISEQYLSHTVKLLNIFHHILNDIVPAYPQSKAVLANLPSASTLSPIKRRKSDLDKKSIALGKSFERDDKIKDIKVTSLCTFTHLPHYIKIYDILKNSFSNYKISLESEASEKFIELLRKTLQSLAVLMEIGTLTEFGKIAEEILNYLRSIFRIDAAATVECVQQLLKCLFAANLTANISEILVDEKSIAEPNGVVHVDDQFGFYYNISQKPYNEMSQCIDSLRNINKIDCDTDNTIMGYLHRKDVKKPTRPHRSLEKTLASYIKIFEPLVIKSLKQYTITSDVKLQCRVLQLLSQLVQLRINYCLLDSEEVFIGFVYKQFEFIEKGQIPLSKELIPKIFQFLVQLSYGKQHSKSIISVPKIIQLCDGLMASEQSPLTHCIPAIESIVEDIFLTRNKNNTTDMKELETTREVVLSMLLRLSEYYEVINFITLILEDSKYYSDNPEKWLRWSKQVSNTIFPLLSQNKIRLDEPKAFAAFRRFIFSLNPEVFRPIDEIVIMLFQDPLFSNSDPFLYNRWLSKILIILLILTQLNEDTFIQKVEQLKSKFSPQSIFENGGSTTDPLNVLNICDTFNDVDAEIIIIRFIFRIISSTSKQCNAMRRNETNEFLIEQFSKFLMYCLHVFQSGSHCKIANKAISIITSNIPFDENDPIQLELINQEFLNLSVAYPTLTFQWCYFLTLLNYKNRLFWAKIFQVNINDKRNLCYKSPCINLEIIKEGGTIVFCDYLAENLSELDQLVWFLSNNISLIVELSEEPPVFEFINSIHRHSAMSKLFIDNILICCRNDEDLVFKTKVLNCIENTHSSQLGAAINLLLSAMLNSKYVALARLVANLASRKIELLLTMPMEEVNSQISKEDLISIKKSLVRMNLVKKHEGLVSLINKLSTQFYDLSPLEFDQRRMVNPAYIKRLQVNKQWYISQIEAKYTDVTIAKEIATLLSKLSYDEIVTFLSTGEFNKMSIEDCLEIGVKAMKKYKLKQQPAIIAACLDCLLTDLSDIKQQLPKHAVYNPFERVATEEEAIYTSSMTKLFQSDHFLEKLHNLSSPISYLLKSSLIELHSYNDCWTDLLNFVIVSLESLNYLIDCDNNAVHIKLFETTLLCTNLGLKGFNFSGILALDTQITWLCSAINSLFKFVSHLLLNEEPSPSTPKYCLKDTIDNPDTRNAGHACYQLYILVSWLYDTKSHDLNIPEFLIIPIKSIIVSLSRLPLVNSYILIAARLWKTGWTPELTGSFNTQVALPIEFLQEIDILEEYIYRINLLGFTSRQQFEETWMCLLSVLCKPMDVDDPADKQDVIHASSLAIQTITSLLMQTLYHPFPGNTNFSQLLHVSRDLPIKEQHLSIKKLKLIQTNMELKYNESHLGRKYDVVNVFNHKNFEKFSNKYSYSQLSVQYLLYATKMLEGCNDNMEAWKVCEKREQLLEEIGLDVNSCLQFLLDYYTQLLVPQTMTHLRIIYQAVRSIVIISDLFTDKSQFNWMLDVFFDLTKLHAQEDELLHQYLIVGICKAAAVLNPELDNFEQIKKLLVQYLKSSFLPSRVACLHGLLYIFEGCKIHNISIGGISDEMQLILPCAVEYVQCHINTSNALLRKSKEHTHLVWSLAFYIIENIDEIHMEQNFVYNTIQTAIMLLQAKPWNSLHKAIIKGLERLIIVRNSATEKLNKQILKLALDKMKNDNPTVAIRGTQLLFTFMYTDCSAHLDITKSSVNVQTSPDHLVQTIEKISAIFERIKRGYVFEVEVLCSILPTILDDFFSPSDILTKVIGEFLSPQQPHPKFLSKVVFKIFESAIRQNQLSLLQDWVVFSLSNFTQSFSIGMATWCLTCFFISASSNDWLRSLFPYVQTRVGRYDYEDRKMLCIAGSDFYKNISNEQQKQTFIDNFEKVKDKPDMPFNDLLSSL